jgi:hypothetical protein
MIDFSSEKRRNFPFNTIITILLKEINKLRFEVLASVKLSMLVFWVVKPPGLVANTPPLQG